MRKKTAESVTIDVIGVIRSCFPEKFGIPRQAGIAPSAVATLELLEPCNREEMVRGLESFSHIWVQFLFHQAVSEGWKTMVRPPRLGGKNRLGVYATRSPHRPNHIGLSAVRLLGITIEGGRVELELGGVDLLDGTPVIDIKPYIPYSDSLKNATAGWLKGDFSDFKIKLLPEAEAFCLEYENNTGRMLNSLIREILSQDPRPPSQRESRSDFGMLLWDVNVRWTVGGGVCTVVSCKVTRDG